MGPAAFFISLAVSPSSAFRLGSAPGVSPLGLYFLVSKAVNVSAILLPNYFKILCSFFQFSPSTLFDRGGEYHSINNKNKGCSNVVSNGLSLEATCYLSIGENRQLLAASPIYSIMAGLETSEEDHHLYPGTIIASFIR